MKFKMTNYEVNILYCHQTLLIYYVKNCSVPYTNLNRKLKAVRNPVTRLCLFEQSQDVT